METGGQGVQRSQPISVSGTLGFWPQRRGYVGRTGRDLASGLQEAQGRECGRSEAFSDTGNTFRSYSSRSSGSPAGKGGRTEISISHS